VNVQSIAERKLECTITFLTKNEINMEDVVRARNLQCMQIAGKYGVFFNVMPKLHYTPLLYYKNLHISNMP